MEMSGQLHPQEEPHYPLDKRLGGPQSRSGRGGEERNSQPLLVFEPRIILLVGSGIPLSCSDSGPCFTFDVEVEM